MSSKTQIYFISVLNDGLPKQLVSLQGAIPVDYKGELTCLD